MTYGQCENAEIARRDVLLPIGLAEGGRLRRAAAKDDVLAFDDVDIADGRASDGLGRNRRTFRQRSLHTEDSGCVFRLTNDSGF
jgi:predicted homoserine dehydrogenase-like protein